LNGGARGGASGAAGADGARELREAAALVFVDDLDPDEVPIELDPADAHHLVDVLRVGPRELVVASDGRGSWRPCVLRPRGTGHGPAISGRRPPRRPRAAARRGGPDVVLEPAGAIATEPAPSRPLTVAFSLTKGSRAEWTVQKLTELGVDRIQPLLSTRTVVQLDDRSGPARDDRLRRVAREAAAQSRNPRLPVVSGTARLDAVLAGIAADGGLAAFAEPGGPALDAATTAVLVGPEGGWTGAELAVAPARLGLGPTVLRAETAAVVAGALLAAVRAGTVLAH